jgi:hypothetical protein
VTPIASPSAAGRIDADDGERDPKGPLDVLWTGGWDSTFIVLDATLHAGREVRPHYLVDPQRPSAEREIRTMERIRAAVIELSPAAGERLAPVRIVARSEIPPDAGVDDWYRALSSRVHVAQQYAWLSRYAGAQGGGLALGIIFRSGGLLDVIGPELEFAGGTWRLREEVSDEAFELFRPFVFPTIELTKLDMREVADARGFRPLLDMTWFCHEPRSNGATCGLCPPCHDARHQGMGWRLSRPARWRGRLVDAAPSGLLKRAVRGLLRRAFR